LNIHDDRAESLMSAASTDHRLRLALLQRGLSLFDTHGYHAFSVRHLADAAGCELDQLDRLFGRKEGIVLAQPLRPVARVGPMK
jgi:AcrR family transcriptional regulator